MKLLIGLGNPGRRYEETRHNVGFRLADLVANELNSTPWEESDGCLISKGSLAGEKFILLKPQLFMNRSGEAAAPVVRFLRAGVEDVLVAHDELDLPVGGVKFKRGGGAAGNRGVEDLIRHLGSGFYRLRIGIGHPRDSEICQMQVSDWVLARPNAQEMDTLAEVSRQGVVACRMFLEGETSMISEYLAKWCKEFRGKENGTNSKS